MQSAEIVIKNGRVLDGSGNPWFYADIAVTDDTITYIGKDVKGEKTINAEGLMVAPGFIDIHSHSDLPLLSDPRGMSKITQGVTTEVIGNCGSSAAPMNKRLQDYRNKYARSQTAEGFVYDWTDLDSYIKRVEQQGVALNIAPLTGHSTIRQNVMLDDNRAPSDTELNQMKQLLRNSLKKGAWGLSSGLIYTPSQYAETDELIELAKELKPFDALYASHIRGEGATVIPAIKEAIEIGEKAMVRVQISHFKVCGAKNWGISDKTLQLVIDARESGIDVDFDQYPYTASSTGLASILPPWVHEGGMDKLLERIKSKEIRDRVRAEPVEEMEDWSRLMVVHAKNNSDYEGLNLLEIADKEQKTPLDAMCDLLLEEKGQVMIVLFEIDEADVRRIMRSHLGMVGSDGRAVSPESIPGKVHPRYYGTFTRALGHYVREGVLPLQHAVRRMTSAPARRLGLQDRGLIREGYKADITVFDPVNVVDKASFTDPHQYSEGTEYVLVNGLPIIEKGVYTDRYPGKVLRKNLS
ncbi:MAG: D-aminoacylase [Candidatus Bathyarchaeota archaeon]|nr:D-aminoacylase [Candidatus Bathyarchaeota archaeon]